MKGALGWVAIISVLAGCSHQSTFVPRAESEVTLTYQDGLVAHLHGQEIGRDGDWRGLVDGLQCVPAAAEEAQRASDLQGRGRALSWTMGGFVIGGLGALGYMGYAGLADPEGTKPGFIEAGLVSLGLLTVGVSLELFAQRQRRASRQAAVNAMHRFNDDPRRCSDAPPVQAVLRAERTP